MSNTTLLPQWDPAWVLPLQWILVHTALVCLGYGCFFILAIIAVRELIRKGLSSPGPRYLLAAVLILLISSTVHCVAEFAFELTNIALGPYNDNQSLLKICERLYIVTTVMTRIIYLLNEVLVVWRAWVLADWRILRIVLACSMLITTGLVMAEASVVIQTGMFAPNDMTTQLMLYIPLLFNNLLATAMVLYKTWKYRTEIKTHMQHASSKGQVESVLFLLIESGFAYCGWWTLYLIIIYVQSVPFVIYTGYAALSPFAAAIYPMLIILVVEHQKRRAEQTVAKSFSHSLRFNLPPVLSRAYGQTSSREMRSVSIIQPTADIQSAQRRSSYNAARHSTSQVWSTGTTSIIQTIVDIQSARSNKKDLSAENRTSRTLHDKDLDSIT